MMTIYNADNSKDKFMVQAIDDTHLAWRQTARTPSYAVVSHAIYCMQRAAIFVQ